MWSCTPRRLRSAHNSAVFSRARALRTTSLLSLRVDSFVAPLTPLTHSRAAHSHTLVTTPLNRRLLRDVWSAVHAASCRVACPDLLWLPYPVLPAHELSPPTAFYNSVTARIFCTVDKSVDIGSQGSIPTRNLLTLNPDDDNKLQDPLLTLTPQHHNFTCCFCSLRLLFVCLKFFSSKHEKRRARSPPPQL